jgi:glycosyltransferase involved in cell wall biosynthesis
MLPLTKRTYVTLERSAAKLSDALITVSERNRQEALGLNLAPPTKITTIYSGIELDRFQVRVQRSAKCRELGLKADAPIVGAIGRLSEQKAPLDFVRAAKGVLLERPDAQFLLVGDGPLLDDVRQAIGDNRSIVLLGMRDDIPEILSVLDVFVSASLWEGLGRALTEAMAMECAVAVTEVNGVPELVSHKVTGLLSPPGEPECLADHILWLLDHPKEAEALGRSARQRVTPAFDVGRMVEQIQSLYSQLLPQKDLSHRGVQEPATGRPAPQGGPNS